MKTPKSKKKTLKVTINTPLNETVGVAYQLSEQGLLTEFNWGAVYRAMTQYCLAHLAAEAGHSRVEEIVPETADAVAWASQVGLGLGQFKPGTPGARKLGRALQEEQNEDI